MKSHILEIGEKLNTTKKLLLQDPILKNDIDFSHDFILPFSTTDKTSQIKLVFIGQDPTVRRKESRSKINVTLNLDKENSLKTYLKKVCNTLEVDLHSEVYATNLYKCFFKFPPADDQTVLTRHFKIWMDLLISELRIFEDATFITLGEPLIKQLIHSNSKKINYYWNYIGQTTSGLKFKCNEPSENYLQKRIYPIAHQPSWNRNKFYKTYLNDYLEYLKRNEK